MEVDLKACLDGRPDAWAAFVDESSAIIHAAVGRALRAHGRANPELAEDIAQDVYVRLVKDDFRLLRNYDAEKAALTTWLTIVARSVTIDALRRRKLPTVPMTDKMPEPAALPAQTDQPEPATRQLPDGVLTGRQTLILGLLYDRQLSVEEAAAALDVSAQTIRSTKHKALERLRKHYGVKQD